MLAKEIKVCKVLGKFNPDDFNVFKRFLDDYAMRHKYGLIDEKILSKDVAVLEFDTSVDERTIEECIHNFLACHILIYTYAINYPIEKASGGVLA